MLKNELLEKLCTFLDQKIGLHYPKERWHDLEKKLNLIKHSFGFDESSAFIEWLIKNPVNQEKLDALTFHLTIGETYFFRDKTLFTTLENKILPDIIKRHALDRTIRIWSAGCCTGEEPYSIAILLHRLIPDLKNWKVFILGSDINPHFLHKAEQARYKKWSFRTTSADIIERYFKKHADGTFKLIPEIQKMVKFERLNLVDDCYPDIVKDIYEMDLIFCHNVLIYFSENQLKKTVLKLTNTLCNNGWLSVTAIEIPFVTNPELNAHRYPGAIFFKKEPSNAEEKLKFQDPVIYGIPNEKRKSNQQAIPPLAKQHSPTIVVNKQVKAKNKEELFTECLHLYHKKAYTEVIARLHESLAFLENNNKAIKENSKEVCLLIRSHANQGNLFEALKWSKRGLQADELNPAFHYLHATLLHDQGNNLDAIKFVKNALFIDPNFIMAYLMLGILEKQQGNNKAAKRCFRVALDLIDDCRSEDILLMGEDFTIEYLKDLLSNYLKNT